MTLDWATKITSFLLFSAVGLCLARHVSGSIAEIWFTRHVGVENILLYLFVDALPTSPLTASGSVCPLCTMRGGAKGL